MAVRVQEADFDVGAEVEALTGGNKRIGGLTLFVGLVREMHVREGLHRERIDALTLEHYPGMTEREIGRHVRDANARWPLLGVTVIHRIGELRPGDNIVLVAVAAEHRRAAFEAAEFLMDYLKARAPFWKREAREGRSEWIDSRDSDEAALRRWRED